MSDVVYSEQWWAQRSRRRHHRVSNALYVGPRPPEPPFWSPDNPWRDPLLFALFIGLLVLVVLATGRSFEL